MYQPKSDNVNVLFPPIIKTREYGEIDINDQLYRIIKDLQKSKDINNAVNSKDITTVRGYQPDVNLMQHLLDNPVWQKFMTEIVHPGIQSYMQSHLQIAGWPDKGTKYSIVACWSVLYPENSFQAPHMHREISCVFTYYAKVPKRPQPEGSIVFINPHPESTFPTLKSWAYHAPFYPKSGTNIIFPGWLQHYSQPHQGDEERLIFTFDVKFNL